MMRPIIASIALLFCVTGQAMEEPDPLIATVGFDQLELTFGDGETGIAWDGEAWIGRDLNKLRFISEGEREDHTGSGNLRLLYSRSVSSFWDIGAGWRREFDHGEQWDALTIEFIGTLPWYLETRASLSAGEDGQTALWIELDYEFLFGAGTPRWVLIPEFELYAYGKDDAERNIGSGLSSLEAGLRLHYQIRPNLSPYAGLEWTRQIGDTADRLRAAGEDTSELRASFGVMFWF